MAAEYIPDHVEQAIARLTYQFKSKPGIRALVSIHAARMQTIEEAIANIATNRPFGIDASTDALGRWGIAVGWPRPGTGSASTNNPIYYAQVLAKILVNSSNGNVNDLMGLFETLGASVVHYSEPYPGTAQVSFTDNLIVEDAALARFASAVTPSITLALTAYSAPPFGFAGNPNAAGFGAGHLSRRII